MERAPQPSTSGTIEFRAREAQAPVDCRPSPIAGSSGNETILLVEDAATVRQLLREVLRSGGYRIVEAADGVEAMEQVAQYDGPIHLVISDVVMPRLNGCQLMEQMRSLRPEAQFLFMSGYMNDKVRNYGLDAPFIQKPFLPSDLLRAVRKVLQQTADIDAGT